MKSTIKKDSGFAWIVLVASFMGHFFQYGVVWTVGYFYVIFLEHFDGSTVAVSLIASLNTATYYCIGPFAGVLINVYGCRKVAFFGSLLGAMGLVLSSIATSLQQLYITFGIMTGCGLGLAYIPCISSVSFYFEKHKSLAFGIATSGVGAGTLIFPLMLDWLNKIYGWRGALLMSGGVCLNQCLCAMAFRCVSKTSEQDSLTSESMEEKINLSQQEHVVFREEKHCVTCNVIHKLKRNMNIHIFRNKGYIVLHINSILVMFSTVLVYIHFGAYAKSVGYNDTTAANLFSTMGISNFIGRLVYGGLGHVRGLSPIGLYTGGFFLSAIVIVLIPCAKLFIPLMCCASAFGLTTACNGSKMPQVMISVLGNDIHVFTSAYGYLLISCGFGALGGGPIAGWIYDTWKYYPASFYVGSLSMFISCGSMFFPWYQIRSSKRSANVAQVNSLKENANSQTSVIVKLTGKQDCNKDILS